MQVDGLMRKFPVGSLVTVEWLCHGPVYNPSDEGWELPRPSLAVVLRHLPEHAFLSSQAAVDLRGRRRGSRWVLPFECLHRGELCISTTFSCSQAGHQEQSAPAKDAQ